MDDAKAKLVVKLQAAEEAYKENPKQGVSQALLAICSHLEALEIPPNLSEPIFALIMALDDVEHGTKNPLLKASESPRRRCFRATISHRSKTLPPSSGVEGCAVCEELAVV
jgi:hypothetical protein